MPDAQFVADLGHRLEFGLNDRSENRGIVGDRSIDQCGSSRFLVFASFDGLETLEGIPELLQGILSCLRLRRKKPADSSIEKTVEIVVSRAETRWTLLTKVETSCDRILIAGGANVEAEWEQGPAV